MQLEEQPINYRRGIALIWVILILLFIIAALGGGIWAYYKYKIWPEMQADNQTNINKKASTNKALKDETAEWVTYTNDDIGYSLKHPKEWVVEETDTTSEITGGPIKYINISTTDKKYSLWLGIKKKTDTFAITDRTGVGAGDLQKTGSITVLGTTVEVVKLVFQGKTREYFYPSPGGTVTSADGVWEFSASFSADYDLIGEQEADKISTYEKIAQKILTTLKTLK